MSLVGDDSISTSLERSQINDGEGKKDSDVNNTNATASTTTYKELLQNNKRFRFFISSYLITNLGEWLTYIASIDLIESKLSETEDGEDQESSSSSPRRTAISILVLVRLLPNVFFSPLGGMLADSRDRRKVMIVLDVAGAICGLLFVVAYQWQSILLVYIATLIQQIVGGLYQPSSNSIVPLLVDNDIQLQKANVLVGLVWSCMQAFGAAASGMFLFVCLFLFVGVFAFFFNFLET